MDHQHGIVKSLTIILRRIASLPPDQWPEPWFRELAPIAEEKPRDRDARCREVIGKRWGYTAASLRQFEQVKRWEAIDNPPANERWPRDSAQFLRDLRQYGGVTFTGANGTERIKRGTLGKGMDPFIYVDVLRRTGGGMSAVNRAHSKPERRSRASRLGHG